MSGQCWIIQQQLAKNLDKHFQRNISFKIIFYETSSNEKMRKHDLFPTAETCDTVQTFDRAAAFLFTFHLEDDGTISNENLLYVKGKYKIG